MRLRNIQLLGRLFLTLLILKAENAHFNGQRKTAVHRAYNEDFSTFQSV